MYLATRKLEFIQLDFYFKSVLIATYSFSHEVQEYISTSQYLSHSNPLFAPSPPAIFLSPVAPPGHTSMPEAKAEPGCDMLGYTWKARAGR